MNPARRPQLFLAILLVSLAADRLLKNFFLARPDTTVGSLSFGLHLWQNTGVAFGLPLPFSARGGAAVIGVVTVGVIALALHAWRQGSAHRAAGLTGRQAGLALIAAGAASNLLDRLRWGAVVDYLAWNPWNSANLADVMITIGALLVVYDLLKASREK